MKSPHIILFIVILFSMPSLGSARTVVFAGLVWDVRTGGGGPGNGQWCDGPDSVWVDDAGLHLQMTQLPDDTWCQAEVTARAFVRYGDHRFYVVKDLDDLDDDLVLALFAYRDDYSEIDMELTQAFNSTHDKGWYVIHGCNFVDGTGERAYFDFTMSGTHSTHHFDWTTGLIDFESLHGHCDAAPCGGVMNAWTYGGVNVPEEWENLRPHISLWFCSANWCHGDKSLAPASGVHEVIIADYQGAVEPAMPEVKYELASVRDAGLRGGGFGDRNYGGQISGPAEQTMFGYGNDDTVYLDYGSAPLRAAVAFDLSSLPERLPLAAAYLRLGFVLASSPASCSTPKDNPLFCYETVEIDPYTDPWTESSITWNNRPPRDPSGGLEQCFPESGFNPSIAFNITPIAKGWRAQTLANNGVELAVPAWESTYPKSRFYLQREGSGVTPTLEIYLIPGIFEDGFESGDTEAWSGAQP